MESKLRSLPSRTARIVIEWLEKLQSRRGRQTIDWLLNRPSVASASHSDSGWVLRRQRGIGDEVQEATGTRETRWRAPGVSRTRIPATNPNTAISANPYEKEP